jgi:ribosomal protein S18 acetylase RimI-like enzyme
MPSADTTLRIEPVRFADPVHVDAVVELLDAYHRDPMGMSAPWDRSRTPALLDGLEKHPTAFVLIAWDGEEALGMAVCFVGFSTFSAKPLVNLHDLVVRPEARRRGVAKALFAAIEAQAARIGAGRVTLEVRKDNEAARALYASLGYGAGDAPMEFWGKALDL